MHARKVSSVLLSCKRNMKHGKYAYVLTTSVLQKQQLACILRIYTKPAIKKDTDSVQCCLVAPMPKPMEVKSTSTRSTLNMCECE